MNVRLSHNHDTSFKVLAKVINDNLKGMFSHSHPELKLCHTENGGEDRNIVSISTAGIASDLEEVISKLSHNGNNQNELLPQIIISKSNAINPTQMGKTIKKFQMQQSVKFENTLDSSDTVTLAGQTFEYESPVQIVILTRSGFAGVELGLSILNILANNHTMKYDMIMSDKEDETQKFLLKDFGVLKLANVDMASFSESTVKNSGIVAIATEFNIRSSYFIFRDYGSIFNKFKVENNYGQELVVDGMNP